MAQNSWLNMKAVLKPNRVREAVKARRYAEKALTTF